VQNKDKCFLWAILAALHPANKDPQRVTKYRKCEHEFDEALKGIEFPVKLTDVSKFAKGANMSINVYCFDNKSIVPLEIIKDEKIYTSIYYTTKVIIVGYIDLKN
jgi:hypothetical protein